jgi:hypothetical protein
LKNLQAILLCEVELIDLELASIDNCSETAVNTYVRHLILYRMSPARLEMFDDAKEEAFNIFTFGDCASSDTALGKKSWREGVVKCRTGTYL